MTLDAIIEAIETIELARAEQMEGHRQIDDLRGELPAARIHFDSLQEWNEYCRVANRICAEIDALKAEMTKAAAREKDAEEALRAAWPKGVWIRVLLHDGERWVGLQGSIVLIVGEKPERDPNSYVWSTPATVQYKR